MSPAMLDVRSPVAESRIQSQQSRLIDPNHKIGQSSSSSSSTLAFGFSDKPVSERLKSETGPMASPNQRNGAGFCGYGSSTPPPPPPSKSEKPNLSRPRLVKLRRHLGSQRAEPLARSGTESRVYLSSNASGDGIVGETRDAFQEWNPFSSVPGKSVRVNSAPLQFGSSVGSATFVFGASTESGPGSSLNSIGGNVGQGVQSVGDHVFVRPGGGAVFSSVGNESGKVGSSSNLMPDGPIESLEEKLPNEIRKLKIDDLTNQSTGSGLGTKTNNTDVSENVQNLGNVKFGNSGVDASFAFRANQSTGVWSSFNSVPSDKLREKLSDETGNYNAGARVNFTSVQRESKSGVNSCSSACNNIGNCAADEGLMFSASQSNGILKTDMKNSRTVEGFQSLGGLKFQDSRFNSKVVFPASQQNHVGNTSDTKPSESVGRSFQDDVQKLNTKIGTTKSGVEPDGANCSVFAEGPSNSRSFRFEKSGGDNGFIFGAENLSESASGNDMNDAFPQNVGQNNQSAGAAPGLNLTPGGLNRGYEDTLPSEIKKLNIKDETRFENYKNKIYTFEFKQRVSSNVSKKSNPEEVSKTSTMASMENSVQDELRKLNIANEHAFQSKGEAGCTYTTKTRANMIPNMEKGFGADVFVFGSKGNTNGGVSGLNSTFSFDEKIDIKLSNDMKKLSVEEMTNGSKDIKDKDISPTPRDARRAFRGSGKDDAQESSTCKNSPKYTESGNYINRPLGDSTFSRSIPTPFTFQAGREINGLGMDDVPPVIPDANAKPSATAPSSSSSFSGPSFLSEINTSEGTATSSSENKAKFPNMGHELNVPVWDPQTPKHDAAYSSKENVCAGLHQNMVFSAKKMSKERATKSKKSRGKLKSRTGLVNQQHSVSREGSSQESSEMSSPIYSPMDFSPYQEDTAADQFSRETSMGSDDIVRQSVGMDAQSDQKFGCLSKEGFMHGPPENESLPCQNEMTNFNNAVGVSGANTSVSNIESQPDVAKSMSGVEDNGRTNFTFAAFPSSQGPSSTRRRQYRKKSLIRDAHDSHTSTPNSEVHMNSPLQFSPFPAAAVQGQNPRNEDAFISQKVKDKESSMHQQSVSAIVAQEACEKWRLRGNQAYANGDLSKAEDCYTQGVKCVSSKETSRTCVRALMLCYSNRAATRMSLGKMREALQDCMMAASIEPNFHRVQLRAANCYLALGETEDALKHFKNCLPSGGDLSLDRKIVIEASDGLQKAKQVFAYMNECTKLLQQRTSDNAVKALELNAKALSISPHSECLIEMKAEALLMLRKYEDVIHLCEETMDSAEKNCAMSYSDTQSLEASDRCKESPARLWRWHLISKCYFYMGKLEEALDFLQKHEIGGSTEDINNNLESATAFTGTIQELLRHKAAGNEAFQAGRHSEAVEHYSAALSCSVESRPFAAICFCNRAAAYQALGQIADAIADCCLAIALDSNYPKALSRRATLHEMIRDYCQATSDLRRLLSLLEKQSEDKADQSKTLGRSTSTTNDFRQARARLATVEEEAKKEVPMDMYLILGIESSAAAVDIKKAYRKAALRHHPDKAGQFLTRSENGDDGLLKEVFDDVHKDADRLFKMIGEAYAVLSDPTKRLRYDAEEEIRNDQKKGGTPKSPVDIRNHPFDKSSGRRQWRETWKTYGNSQHRWSESSRSHRY